MLEGVGRTSTSAIVDLYVYDINLPGALVYEQNERARSYSRSHWVYLSLKLLSAQGAAIHCRMQWSDVCLGDR